MGMPAYEGGAGAPPQAPKTPMELLIEGGPRQLANELTTLLTRMKAGELTADQVREKAGGSLDGLISTVEKGN